MSFKKETYFDLKELFEVMTREEKHSANNYFMMAEYAIDNSDYNMSSSSVNLGEGLLKKVSMRVLEIV